MAGDYQLDYNGTVIGDGTTWDVTDWSGLEEWTSRNTDVVIPAGWGSLGGSSFVNPRVVTITVETVDPVAATLLETVLVPPPLSNPSALYPIRWKFPNREELTAQARVARRGRPRTLTTALGLTSLTFELEIPDPRAYAYVPSSFTAPQYSSGTTALDLTAGSGADLAFDLTLASGADIAFSFVSTPGAGLINVINSGDVETYASLQFTCTGSSVTQWTLTNQTTGIVSTFNTTLNPGSVMVVDMRAVAAGSATVVPVTINGSSIYSAWVAPRVPMAFPPGTSVLRLDVLSGTGVLSCQGTLQSAYL